MRDIRGTLEFIVRRLIRVWVPLTRVFFLPHKSSTHGCGILKHFDPRRFKATDSARLAEECKPYSLARPPFPKTYPRERAAFRVRNNARINASGYRCKPDSYILSIAKSEGTGAPGLTAKRVENKKETCPVEATGENRENTVPLESSLRTSITPPRTLLF